MKVPALPAVEVDDGLTVDVVPVEEGFVGRVLDGGVPIRETEPNDFPDHARHRALRLRDSIRRSRKDGLDVAADPVPNKGWVAQVVEHGEVILESETHYPTRGDAMHKAQKMLDRERYDRVQLMLPIGE